MVLLQDAVLGDRAGDAQVGGNQLLTTNVFASLPPKGSCPEMPLCDLICMLWVWRVNQLIAYDKIHVQVRPTFMPAYESGMLTNLHPSSGAVLGSPADESSSGVEWAHVFSVLRIAEVASSTKTK